MQSHVYWRFFLWFYVINYQVFANSVAWRDYGESVYTALKKVPLDSYFGNSSIPIIKSLDSNLPPNINSALILQRVFRKGIVINQNIISAETARRRHLAAIVVLQWYFESLKEEQAIGKRGAAILIANDVINRFYLRYIDSCNEISTRIKINYKINVSHIYQVMSQYVNYPLVGSNLAYSRQNISSHLQQLDLKETAEQFGIDMRLHANADPLPLLPSKATHLLLGFIKDPADNKVNLFYKQEGYGLSSDGLVSHMSSWLKHKYRKKAKTGARETNPPTREIHKFIRMLQEFLSKNDVKWVDKQSLLIKLRTQGAKTYSIGCILQEITDDIVLNSSINIHPSQIESLMEAAFGKNPRARIGSEQMINLK